MDLNNLNILFSVISIFLCIAAAEKSETNMQNKMKLAQIAKECSAETRVDNMSAKKVILGELSSIDDDDMKAKVS